MNPDYLEAFARRVLADALLEATGGYWLRRAETFEAAAHRVGDWAGHTTSDQLDAQRRRCLETAAACRNAAALAPLGDAAAELVARVWQEPAQEVGA